MEGLQHPASDLLRRRMDRVGYLFIGASSLRIGVLRSPSVRAGPVSSCGRISSSSTASPQICSGCERRRWRGAVECRRWRVAPVWTSSAPQPSRSYSRSSRFVHNRAHVFTLCISLTAHQLQVGTDRARDALSFYEQEREQQQPAVASAVPMEMELESLLPNK